MTDAPSSPQTGPRTYVPYLSKDGRIQVHAYEVKAGQSHYAFNGHKIEAGHMLPNVLTFFSNGNRFKCKRLEAAIAAPEKTRGHEVAEALGFGIDKKMSPEETAQRLAKAQEAVHMWQNPQETYWKQNHAKSAVLDTSKAPPIRSEASRQGGVYRDIKVAAAEGVAAAKQQQPSISHNRKMTGPSVQ
ncbi:MAG: hypothetical protein PHW63_04180 [Alphaproteobacteria bacterium]|nr:hypothetical protein [Alphaproteobacteria bacterium]